VTFEEFLAARLPALLRYAMTLTGDPHRADDVVQEVLVRAQRKWRRIRAMDAPEAYVKRMITNEYLSWRRRRSSKDVPLSDGLLDALTEPVRDPALQYGDREVVWAVLAALPPRQRAAVALRYYEELSYPEIADVLGCSEATVRSHVSHALSTLRTNLMNDVVEEAR
jgi:RNA polymerase sigma-70 factor (sigma-E family)